MAGLRGSHGTTGSTVVRIARAPDEEGKDAGRGRAIVWHGKLEVEVQWVVLLMYFYGRDWKEVSYDSLRGRESRAVLRDRDAAAPIR
jgi:hypothetical protein